MQNLGAGNSIRSDMSIFLVLVRDKETNAMKATGSLARRF